MSRVLPPGSCIGILGSGQLGRMLALAARSMGYRVHTLSPDRDSPTGQVADREVVADYNDLDAVAAFAAAVDVVTFEFENIPIETAEAAARAAPVRPAGQVLHICQNRLREKTFLADHGIPVAPFRPVQDRGQLETATAELGFPCVLKTAGFGYDGKGQRVLHSTADLEAAWQSLGAAPCVLEAFIGFDREVSVVIARGLDGDIRHWGVNENRHHHHILDQTTPDAPLPADVLDQAIAISRAIVEQLEVVGVLCVEFFVTDGDRRLLVNELAPRPHNSGHVSIDAHVTSQFEQQLRAICGLPLGDTALLRPASMVNLLGDLWEQGEPDWSAALAHPGVMLHLYGKAGARPGRKMGHLVAYGDTRDQAMATARAARDALTPKPAGHTPQDT